VITSDKAFDLMVEACPSYWAATDLDRFVASFEEPDDPDLFVRISAFAHHLVDLIASNDTDEVRDVFGIVEQLITEGDEDTTELVELGLIESMQNIVSHDDVLIDESRITPLLGPQAAKVWDRHDELWREAGRWRHDGPRVEQVDYDNIADPNLRRYFQAHKRRLADGALISASDIVHYQTELKNINPLMPAGRPQIPWPSLVFGVVIAICLALALYLRPT
jgi:hypothetical protein